MRQTIMFLEVLTSLKEVRDQVGNVAEQEEDN
jgi:hypothetical protein